MIKRSPVLMHTTFQPLTSSASGPLHGDITVPGDKSISHRSLLLSSQCLGTSHITGLLEGDDVIATANALKAMGVTIRKDNDGTWVVQGVGVGGLQAPAGELDLGNSGTGVRLLMGLVSPYDFKTRFTGDASLCKRPMLRVTKPLEQMGVSFECQDGGRLPLTVKGTCDTVPIRYALPVASAQVKSAILLAGLNTPGKTTVIEPEATRDHTERMLLGFGAEIVNEETAEGKVITLTGQPTLRARDIVVPGDPSSAAFAVVAALITPGSNITIRNICMNPLRIGLYDTLKEMGGDISYENMREQAGEMVADIVVRHSALHGVDVPEERAPSMIDEYPVLSVAAACAKGKTTMRGLKELRVKESDRLQAIADGLAVCGVAHETGDDWLAVTGGAVKGGGTVATHMDHRIAMSFLVVGLVAKAPVTVDDGQMINTSFPGFVGLMNRLGARLKA